MRLLPSICVSPATKPGKVLASRGHILNTNLMTVLLNGLPNQLPIPASWENREISSPYFIYGGRVGMGVGGVGKFYLKVQKCD